jgi:sarcosine oxidase subunit gamma
MFNAVSALDGKAHQGFVKVSELGLRGMLTVRGDLSSKVVRKAVTTVTGVDFPNQGECNCAEDQGIAWMSPDELLVMVAYDQVATTQDSIEKALAKEHALVANVSDARAVIRLEGHGLREVIAKVSPVDMSVDGFQIGRIRRSRVAQVPAAFWMRDDETLDLICFRSVADYAFDVLSRVSMEGTEVGVFK